MDAMDCIKGRRSIRRFTDQPVTREDIAALIETATYAPSWKNTQTARYIAVLDPELKAKIADTCVMGHASNRRIITQAPALIALVTIEGRSGYERDGGFSTAKGTHWQSFDAGVATQTFCLAAYERGLGTVIMGIYDPALTAQALSLPEGRSVSALIALGHPAETLEAPKRKGVEELAEFI
ncbi:MAG: nitroreductase family protein [Oscillospiraceae bacterium]|nr:nitroreductase family protein [Oscillospiraceae bacterium]